MARSKKTQQILDDAATAIERIQRPRRTRWQAYRGPLPATSAIGTGCPECRYGTLVVEDYDLLQCDNCGWWKEL